MKRFQKFDDLFIVRCKNCNSEDVDLTPEECSECGLTIKAECNNCGQTYDYHSFKKIEVK